MTDNISISRELLERIVGKCKLSVLGDDHAKVWELLAAAPIWNNRAQQSAPAGYVMVPVEPNEALLDAMWNNVQLEPTDNQLKVLYKAILAAAPKAEPQPVSDAYRMAVDTGLVCAHIGVTDPEDDYETARKKLNDLICWSVQVDRDLGQPSDDARDALVEALEDAIDYLNEPLNSIQHGSILYSQMCEALAAYRAAKEKKA